MSVAQVAVVTGAGSGVGRVTAIRLAEQGWRVALVGRRPEMLQETITQAGEAGPGRMMACPCDISNAAEVAAMAQQVEANFGPVAVLVNAAGTNTPRRSLEQLEYEDYRRIVEVNLNGAYLCVQAFLPQMRRQQAGTIVNIVSEAGLRANAKAGPAYVASKFGLSGLTQAINAEERSHGVRSCAIFPGDINTPLLDLRPSPPPPEARQDMLQPEDIADCVLLAINLPPRAIIEELVIRPR